MAIGKQKSVRHRGKAADIRQPKAADRRPLQRKYLHEPPFGGESAMDWPAPSRLMLPASPCIAVDVPHADAPSCSAAPRRCSASSGGDWSEAPSHCRAQGTVPSGAIAGWRIDSWCRLPGKAATSAITPSSVRKAGFGRMLSVFSLVRSVGSVRRPPLAITRPPDAGCQRRSCGPIPPLSHSPIRRQVLPDSQIPIRPALPSATCSEVKRRAPSGEKQPWPLKARPDGASNDARTRRVRQSCTNANRPGRRAKAQRFAPDQGWRPAPAYSPGQTCRTC